MNKSDLRKLGKETLRKVSPVLKKEKEIQMYEHLFHTKLWENAQSVGTTISQDHEWSTFPIIERGWADKKIVAVPKCEPDAKQLDFYQLTDYHQLETVYFGLQEPDPTKTAHLAKEKIDLLIVPGLLFNDEGYRIGYGGGYYDRFLQNYQGQTVMIASEEQRHQQLPVEAFDKKVSYIITENGIKST
ncbi:5-formyltetrahydrofolate cyclo-ligase [Halobacillus sp. BBL2006]|uniref:5-formyltetrahydrofolate cyclo-ligase n=1 Tax=Halobacillus sp. BBL2006 TaxID=1543706 RepID=UPI000691984B|nr:5-formyltetrahydrofolate cyclo-ligase [Halobacillus sp. BBL2006]